MMKKSRSAVIEPSPSSPSWFPFPVGEEARVRFNPCSVQDRKEARARFRHQVLLQDYEELLKETEAKKKKLRRTIQKKLHLMAEVKFLRRKVDSFAKNPSRETPYRLKKKFHRMPALSVQIAQPQDPVNQIEFPSKGTKQKLKEAGISRPSGLLDLNQISLPTAEEMQEFPMEWEPSKEANESKWLPTEGDAVANSFKRSVAFRDVENGSSNVTKRKISWQAQVALRA